MGPITRLAMLVGLSAVTLCTTPSAYAQEQTLHVLLSSQPGAPSAAAIVEGFDFAAGGTPPLSGLAAETPVDAQYLLPKRASGAFAEYLASHPDTPRAKLERYIVVRYSSNSMTATALGAIVSDCGAAANDSSAREVRTDVPTQRALIDDFAPLVADKRASLATQ